MSPVYIVCTCICGSSNEQTTWLLPVCGCMLTSVTKNADLAAYTNIAIHVHVARTHERSIFKVSSFSIRIPLKQLVHVHVHVHVYILLGALLREVAENVVTHTHAHRCSTVTRVERFARLRTFTRYCSDITPRFFARNRLSTLKLAEICA